MKKIWSRFISFVNKNKTTLSFFTIELLYLVIIELCNQYIIARSNDIYLPITNSGTIFSIIWITKILLILYILKPIIRRYFTLILNIFLLLFTIINYFMFAYFHTICSFKDLFLAGEGLSFISSIYQFIHFKIIAFIIASIIIIIIIFKLKITFAIKIKSKQMIIVSILLICLIYSKATITNKMKKSVEGWNSIEILSANTNYYNSWIDSVKLLKICGTYEYITRDFYFTFLKKENLSEAKDNVSNYLKSKVNKDNKNEYTGIMKGKNLIYVLMESEDDWMINEKVTPTIYKMMNHGFNFTNHYSPGYITGDTISTEFIANSGIYPNIAKLAPNYAYVNNSYPYSIANVFTNEGYIVNSFHRSSGTIYNRINMHSSLGYQKYHNYYDMGIPEEYLDLDTYIIKNAYSKIVSSDKFMSFIITYSGHDPYKYDKIECQNNIEEIKKLYPNETNEEVLCSYSASRELDNMFKLLIERLKEDNLLNNTVIVAFSDHRNKDISLNNEDSKLNKTAFFIYDNTLEQHNINTITSGINIMPTIFNLFGINNNYVYPGYDALSEKNGYVIFRDYTYFDGTEIKPITDSMLADINYSAGILVLDYYNDKK